MATRKKTASGTDRFAEQFRKPWREQATPEFKERKASQLKEMRIERASAKQAERLVGKPGVLTGKIQAAWTRQGKQLRKKKNFIGN